MQYRASIFLNKYSEFFLPQLLTGIEKWLIFVSNFLNQQTNNMNIEQLTQTLKNSNINFEVKTKLIAHNERNEQINYIEIISERGQPSHERRAIVSMVADFNRQQEQNAIAAIEQKIAAEKAAQDEQLQILQQQIEVLQKASLTDEAKLAAAKRVITRKIMIAVVAIFIPTITATVSYINYTNVSFLFAGIIPAVILGALSFIVAAMLIIFAWVRDKENLSVGIAILPIDIIISFFVKNITNSDSAINQMAFIQNNNTAIVGVLYVVLLSFYGYVIYASTKKVYSLFSEDKYKEYMEALLLKK